MAVANSATISRKHPPVAASHTKVLRAVYSLATVENHDCSCRAYDLRS